MSETPQTTNRSSSINPITGVTFNILTIPNSSTLSKYRTAAPVEQKVLEEIKSEDIIEAELDNTDLAQEYFKEDPDQEPEDEDTIRRRYQNGKLTNLYECYFKPGVFLEFLLYHALYFCLLGPAIAILTPIVGWKVLYNQQFVGLGPGQIRQAVEFAITISFLIVFYMTDMIGMQAIEVYMMFVGIMIRIIIISSKYAYQTLCFLKMVRNTKLTKQDRDGDNLLSRWRLQNDEIIQEEIQSAILRLEIDSPLFFFNFLGETSQELKNKFSKKQKLGKMLTIVKKPGQQEDEDIMPSVKLNETSKDRTMNRTMTISKSPRDPGSEQVSYAYSPKEKGFSDDRSMNSTFSRPLLALGTTAVFRAFSHFFDYKQLEEQYLYGYSIAFDLIRQSREVRYDNMGKKMLALSIFRALIPTFYRIYLISYKKEDIPLLTDKPYIVVIIFILNSFLFWANSFMLVQSVQAFKSKIWCFKQIGYMISPKKIHYFKERKLYPTLNIFDPITLKTWANLRKIMKEYGKKYFLRNNLNIAIAMVFYFFIFATLILQAFGVFKAFSDPLMFIVFGFETVVYFVIFASVMSGAAFLNNQYKVHKNLLKKNKTIIADFQRLSHLYVGKDAIKPDNIIYKEGLRILKNELGEDCFQEKLVERAELLTGMIDDIIEDLEFEETNEPFTVMGVAVDYNLLKSLMVGVVSLAFALGQSLAN